MVKGIKPTSSIDNIAHHQFVDDNIFLGKDALGKAQAFKGGLENFEKSTNQKINLNKSSIFFVNTKGRIQRKISRILDMPIRKLPTNYLGMPLFIVKMSKEMQNPIIDRMQRKLAGWKGSLLSQVDKI